MRVLWVTNMFFEPGALSARGIFVTQQRDALLATGKVEIETELVAQGRGPLDYVGSNARVRARWDRGRFDLLHVHYGLTGLATLMMPSSCPMIFTFYGSDVNHPVQRTLSVATARRAIRRIFVARRLAEQWPDGRNVVIPNGVDFDVCAPRDREAVCRALGLDPSKRFVLFGAHPDNAPKRYELFRAALEHVQRLVPGACELILTEAGQTYERVVAKLNAADVLLFTSRRGTEGSPTVVKEAVAVGLPVVSTDVGDVREVLAGVTPGGVVDWPPGAGANGGWVEDLARRVVATLEAKGRSNGREMRPELRSENVAARVLALYEDAVRDSQRK